MKRVSGSYGLVSPSRYMTDTVDIEVFLGYFTGLRVLSDTLPFPTLVGTALLVHLLDSVLCRVFARNNGYPQNLWMILGFVFGIWAVAAIILLPKRHSVQG